VSKSTKDSTPDQAQIDDEAARWLLRRSEGPLTRDEDAEFDRWLESHPQHSVTFATMSGVWAHTGGLRHLAHLAPVKVSDPIQRHLYRPSVKRRWILGGVAASAAATATLLFFTASGRHSTGIGETRTVSLPDGSSVVLGAKSRVRVSYSSTERRVQLIAGEALFEVKHDAALPFVVQAGDQLIRDIGTKFDINRSESSVRVFVLQGAVEISTSAATVRNKAPPVEVVKAGDGLEAVYRATSGAAPVAYAKSPQSSPDAWRRGWLVYENATLRDVVADVNRYYSPGVELSPAAAEMRVTASIRTSQIPSFLDALDSALPVRVVREASGQVDVEPR
jgi:transmembrane sensor